MWSIVLGCLTQFLAPEFRVIDEYVLTTAFVSKMFIKQTASLKDDSWALVTLRGSHNSPPLDLKFVQQLSRPYQFSLDSFQIFLDEGDLAPLLTKFRPDAPLAAHPLVVLQSSFGNIGLALSHLDNNIISVHDPADMAKVHGGGLLKYCSLISRGFVCDPTLDVDRLELYMCNRFFVDFSVFEVTVTGVPAPMQRIQDFIATHLLTQPDEKKIAFLRCLVQVLRRSGGNAGSNMIFLLCNLVPALGPKTLPPRHPPQTMAAPRLSYSNVQPVRKDLKKGRIAVPHATAAAVTSDQLHRRASFPNLPTMPIVLTQVAPTARPSGSTSDTSSDNDTSSVTSNASAETTVVVQDHGYYRFKEPVNAGCGSSSEPASPLRLRNAHK